MQTIENTLDPGPQNHVAKHLEAITQTTNDAIISANSEGNIISLNPAAEKIFCCTKPEMIGKPLTIIIPERYHEMHNAGIKRVVSGGPKHVIGKAVELSGVRKNGEEFPLELTLSTWELDGRIFFGAIIRDISERKAAEQLMKDKESRFRSITETANDAIISANTKGLIISWNITAQKIFGHSEKEVIGKPLTVIVPEKYRDLHDAGIQRVISGGPKHVIGKTAELEGLHKDGHTFPIELSLSMWESAGQSFFTGIIRDITIRKMHELELEKNKNKLANKNKKLKELNDEVKQKNEQLQALSNKLAKYLSRQVYTSIFQGKKDVKIESYRKKLTVFFSDIQGFTELTDRVESEVLTSVLNKYLNAMSQIALECGGTIDKFIGDAIMIFYGDPETLGEKQDALACIRMAIMMREKLVELRREWDILGIATPLSVRMGINTGFCTVGNFGSEERLDYTIVGGPVNLASRLESAAEVNEILISHDTYSLIKDEVVCEKKEELYVKGQAYPVQTYQVIDFISDLKTRKEKLEAALKGFNLSIDFDQLNYTDKLYAKELLSKAIAKLE
jgi:PAS domain S-box-containing protein